jgi:hypothetical protein
MLHQFGVRWVLGVTPMEISWQADSDRLVCRWSEAGERLRYSPQWMRDAPEFVDEKTGCAPAVAFTKLSPFGAKDWYGPRRSRAK